MAICISPVISLRVDPDGIISNCDLWSVINFKQFDITMKTIEDRNKDNLLSKSIPNYVLKNHNHINLANCLYTQLINVC